MKRILLTGMSATGKSTLVVELAARGYRAVDLDCQAYSQWVVEDGSQVAGTPVEAERDWVWREERVQELLDAQEPGVLFLSGCASNMGRFRPQFDHVILLSAPAEVIVARLAGRTGEAYGQQPDQVARVLSLIEEVEPLLRRSASHEIDTQAPIDQVVETILRIARA